MAGRLSFPQVSGFGPCSSFRHPRGVNSRGLLASLQSPSTSRICLARDDDRTCVVNNGSLQMRGFFLVSRAPSKQKSLGGLPMFGQMWPPGSRRTPPSSPWKRSALTPMSRAQSPAFLRPSLSDPLSHPSATKRAWSIGVGLSSPLGQLLNLVESSTLSLVSPNAHPM